jgi:ribosomal protein S27AE
MNNSGLRTQNSELFKMADQDLLRIDVEKRTTRGRACPRCGGKIIPSNRAVYQGNDPAGLFPAWQCERCGYEEISERSMPAGKAKH